MLKIFKLVFKIILAVTLIGFIYLYGLSNFDIPASVKHDSVEAVEINSIVQMLVYTSDLKKIKEDGFNTVLITVPYFVYGEKPRTLPLMFSAAGLLVKRAHLNELSVMLVPEINMTGVSDELKRDPVFKDEVILVSRRWAEFSEKYHVEYYSPLKNPDEIFSKEGTELFLREVFPDIKERYSGSTVLFVSSSLSTEATGSLTLPVYSLSLSGPEGKKNMFIWIPNVKGYDYFVYTFIPFAESRDLGLFTQDIREAVAGLKRSSMRSGFGKPIVRGLNSPVQKIPLLNLGFGPVITEEQQAEFVANNISLMRSMNTGFIITDWSSPGLGIKNRPVEKTIQEKLAGEK